MSTITTGSVVHTPEVIVGFEASREVGTLVHRTLGGSPSVTLRAAGPDSGRAVAVFDNEPDARALMSGLASAATALMMRDDVGSAAFVTFVPQGELEIEVDTETFVWLVTFDWVQVTA